MQRVPMTAAGERRLREELEQLKGEERPRITAAIAEARAHGDLSENAEYHAARERQGMVEARIRDLEAKLSSVQVIDIMAIPYTGKVVFGATVDLVAAGGKKSRKKQRYQVVGEDEADAANKKISVTSPMARALIGKEEGEVVTVKTPSGEMRYKIKKVHHI